MRMDWIQKRRGDGGGCLCNEQEEVALVHVRVEAVKEGSNGFMTDVVMAGDTSEIRRAERRTQVTFKQRRELVSCGSGCRLARNQAEFNHLKGWYWQKFKEEYWKGMEWRIQILVEVLELLLPSFSLKFTIWHSWRRFAAAVMRCRLWAISDGSISFSSYLIPYTFGKKGTRKQNDKKNGANTKVNQHSKLTYRFSLRMNHH